MSSFSFPKVGLLSSTPVQSPDDSGYIGSGQKRLKSNFNALSSCSPIKESSVKNASEIFPSQYDFYDISAHLRFDDHSDYGTIKHNSLSSVEANEYSELEFATSNSNSENEVYKTTPSTSKTKDKFWPSSELKNKCISTLLLADKDIAYKIFDCKSNSLNSDRCTSIKNFADTSPMPRDHVNYWNASTSFKQRRTDFIHELNIRNCTLVVSKILSYLSAKELCIASCVNKEWNEVMASDSKGNARREKFIEERHLFLNGPLKENRLGMRCGPAQEPKRAFSNLTNTYSVIDQPLVSKAPETKFDSFLRESKTEEKLQKCPKCCYASKYLDKSMSLCTRCCYKFCSHCLGPILKSHSCFKVPLPKICIGSRKSKKNLKRL